MVSVGVSRMGRQGWSSSTLERKLTAHTTAISSPRRVCCLTSEQYVGITGGHCSRMERQRTPPGQWWTIRKKSTSTSLNLTCGLQIALILIPWITLFGVLFSNEKPPKTIQDGGRTEASESQWVAKLSQRFNDSSINEWRRRLGSCYQEWRRTHLALQLGLSSRTSFQYYQKICLVNKTKLLTPIFAVVFVLLGKVVTQ